MHGFDRECRAGDMKRTIQAFFLGAVLAIVSPTILSQEVDGNAGAVIPIPDGFLRVQTPPEWRGITSDWYQAQAFVALIQMQSETSTSFASVTLVDLDTGEIPASFTSDELQPPAQ